MKLLLNLFFLIFLTSATVFGTTYYTPGTGVRWNLNDLVINSGGIVTFGSGFYQVNDTVKVRAGDTLYITSDATVKFALNKLFISAGVLTINPPTGVLFTAIDTAQRYSGVRIDSNSATTIRKLTMEYASGGLKITDCDILVDSCIFRYNNTVTTFNNGTIATFRTASTISNCQFIDNYRAAIQGGANVSNPIKVIGNYFIGNNKLNQNVPQINMGTSGNDTIKIINNQILRASTNSGGIGFLPTGDLYAVITGNVIKNNRYGINLQGGSNINAIVSYNIIDSNNTQNNPNLGGSGIAFAGGTAASQQNSIVTGNIIRWNLWGITIQNRAKPNLGNITNADTTDDGKNYFFGNTNSTTPLIDLFNNTVDSIYAQNNYWGTNNLDTVEMRIQHSSDNSALGPVYYRPIHVSVPDGAEDYGSNGRTGSSLYYFANSTPDASSSPSQPVFSWRDTTGSTSLILNRAGVSTLGAGTLNDGRYDILSQLGGSSIRLFGADYNNFYIGTNGIIGLIPFVPDGVNAAPPSSGLLTSNISNAIFPLWMDFDFSSATGPASNRLSYKITADEVIVTYENVYVSTGTASTYATFQVIIQKLASPTQNSRVIVQYDYNRCGADFIAAYNNNTLPTHLVGLQGVTNTVDSEYLQYRFKTGNTLVTEGPLFGSPLAVAFGPDVNALPVELASFTASVNNNNVSLNWKTVNETNNKGFEIERRSDVSNSWSNIGFVEGAHNSHSEKNYSFNDNSLNAGRYSYRLKQIDFNGNFEYHNLNNEVIIGVPTVFSLSQNYPNPFNPTTKIDFALPVDAKVSLKLYDLVGREVANLVNETKTAGYYSVNFNASSLSSGVYFYKLTAEGSSSFTLTKKMTLIK